MPMVLHELNNATQYLGMLHSVHTQDPSSGVFERSAENLGETASAVEELGLLMAILSTAAGTDLLLERRSDRGLSIALTMTIRALRKRGVEVTLPPDFAVLGSADAAQGWELPWAVCGSVWAACHSLNEGESLALSFDDGGWGAAVHGGEALASHLALVSQLLPDVSGSVTGESWAFHVPAGWIATSP